MSEPLPPVKITDQFLSRIPDRRPMDKLHSNVGHAKSGVNYYFNGFTGRTHGNIRIRKAAAERKYEHTGCDMEIYQMGENGWELLYEIKKGDEELPWRKGELAEFRSEFNKNVMSEEQKLKAHIEEAGIAALNRDRISRYSHDGEGNYYKGFAAGYLLAKEEYERH